MRMFIPEIGLRIKLAADWTFPLYHERRNDALLRPLSIKSSYSYGAVPPSTPYTLPAGTILGISRVYIRSGLAEFSSITFTIVPDMKKKPKERLKTRGRFWAKLSDVNRIEFEFEEEDQPWWHGIAEKLLAGEKVVAFPKERSLGLAVKHRTGITLIPKTTEGKDELAAKPLVVQQKGAQVALHVVTVQPPTPHNSYVIYTEQLVAGRRSRGLRVTDIIGFADILPQSELELLASIAEQMPPEVSDATVPG